MTTPHESPLGRGMQYPESCDPGLLFPIARAPARAALGIGAELPFHGVDIWNAYELSWLDARGKPTVAIGELRIPATTPNIVESKSLKLYLAGFHQQRFEEPRALRERIARDLSAVAGGAIDVVLTLPEDFGTLAFAQSAGESIDREDIAVDHYGPPDADLLKTLPGDADECLVSDLLKSNCPVTGQPDWASVEIRYAGPRIDRASLLRYIVSFRRHADFHEHCAERIYTDLARACAPRTLTVFARYTRRGGLDINPWRSSEPGTPPNRRTARQ